MRNTRLRGWIELVAGASVIAGLFLVVQEIKQNNEYARAESIRDISQLWADIYQFEAANDIGQLLSKSITDPNELTDDELHMLNSYYWLVLNAELTDVVMGQSDFSAWNLAEAATIFSNEYFLSPFGRAWFAMNGEFISILPEYHKAIVETIESSPVQRTDSYLESLRSHF